MNIFEIIINHNKTFYNFRTNESRRPIYRYFIVVIISLFTAFFGSDFDGAIRETIITSFSILLGFGFSVIFYLGVDNNALKNESGHLEDELKNEKINKVRRELFFNVAYFNITALLTIFIIIISQIKFSEKFNNYFFDYIDTYFFRVSEVTFGFIICTLVLESFIAFFVVIKKVNYMVEQRGTFGH
ncbi:MAG: hypothetical protein SFV20_04680 [Sphingopyxis sp.]|nr:hypothetical protein [Sphingopyxis sp.]